MRHGGLGGFLGPYLVGFIRDRTQSFTDGILLLAGWLIVCAALVLKQPLRGATG